MSYHPKLNRRIAQFLEWIEKIEQPKINSFQSYQPWLESCMEICIGLFQNCYLHRHPHHPSSPSEGIFLNLQPFLSGYGFHSHTSGKLGSKSGYMCHVWMEKLLNPEGKGCRFKNDYLDTCERDLRKPQWQCHWTNVLMRSTMAMYMCYNSWCISPPSSAKQLWNL